MEEQWLAKINFENYLVEEIDFKINRDYMPTGENINVDLNINHNIDIDMDENRATLLLEAEINENFKEKKLPFYLKVDLVSFFVFDVDVHEDEVTNLLEVNGVSIAFPYLRSLITNITSNSGLPPLVIPTLNVAEYIKSES